MTDEETIEQMARHIFKFFYHDVEWGQTGTVDDETWRDFEEGCLDTARELLALRDSKGERVLFTKEDVVELKMQLLTEANQIRDEAIKANVTAERERIVKFLHKQGAVWVDKNYAIIEHLENSISKGVLRGDCPNCTWKDGYFVDSQGNICSDCKGTGKGERVLFTKSDVEQTVKETYQQGWNDAKKS